MRRLLDPYDALGDRLYRPLRSVEVTISLACVLFTLGFVLDARWDSALFFVPAVSATALMRSHRELAMDGIRETWWERPTVGIAALFLLASLVAGLDRAYYGPADLHSGSHIVAAAFPKVRELFWLCTVALPGYGALLVMRRARRMSAALAGRQVLALG